MRLTKEELDHMVREGMSAFRADPGYVIEMVRDGARIRAGEKPVRLITTRQKDKPSLYS